jgi:hypothetical protein
MDWGEKKRRTRFWMSCERGREFSISQRRRATCARTTSNHPHNAPPYKQLGDWARVSLLWLYTFCIDGYTQKSIPFFLFSSFLVCTVCVVLLILSLIILCALLHPLLLLLSFFLGVWRPTTHGQIVTRATISQWVPDSFLWYHFWV